MPLWSESIEGGRVWPFAAPDQDAGSPWKTSIDLPAWPPGRRASGLAACFLGAENPQVLPLLGKALSRRKACAHGASQFLFAT